jgi:hypothetical protein
VYYTPPARAYYAPPIAYGALPQVQIFIVTLPASPAYAPPAYYGAPAYREGYEDDGLINADW